MLAQLARPICCMKAPLSQSAGDQGPTPSAVPKRMECPSILLMGLPRVDALYIGGPLQHKQARSLLFPKGKLGMAQILHLSRLL